MSAVPDFSAKATAGRLPSIEEMTAFFLALRTAGYVLEPWQLSAAHKLLLAAQTERWDLRRLKNCVTAVLSKSPGGQNDILVRFDMWFNKLSVSSNASRPATALTKMIRRGKAWPIIFAAALILGVSLGVHFPTPPSGPVGPVPVPTNPTPPPNPGRVELSLLARLTITALPLCFFLVWALMRWWRQRLWASWTHVLGEPELTELDASAAVTLLFSGPMLLASAQKLQRRRRIVIPDLDIERTAEATAREAGLFTPVWRVRAEVPGYLFLLEQYGPYDHLARLIDSALNELHREGVFIERLYFNRNPLLLARNDQTRTFLRLNELQYNGNGSQLIFVGSPSGFADPLTGMLVERIRQVIASWNLPILLKTEPLGDLSENEQDLLKNGMSLGVASSRGISALAAHVADGTLRSGQVIREAAPLALDVAPPGPLPEWITGGDIASSHGNAGDEEDGIVPT